LKLQHFILPKLQLGVQEEFDFSETVLTVCVAPFSPAPARVTSVDKPLKRFGRISVPQPQAEAWGE